MRALSEVRARPAEPIYLLARQRISLSSTAFVAALEAAHEERIRPLCLCVEDGVEMYTARVESGCILKRMPGTGSRHAAWCPSYEPPEEWSGVGHLMGSAIRRDPVHGGSILRLGFSLSTRTRQAASSVKAESPRAEPEGRRRLSMRALAHYLWEQAELNRWSPAFEGKRSWATVRRRLLAAAAEMTVGRAPLASRLYVPEPFRRDTGSEILETRRRQFFEMSVQRGSLSLLVAELKDLVPARGIWHLFFKHMPDTPCLMTAELHERACRTFEREFSLWTSNPTSRLMVIASFAVNSAFKPTISQMCMLVTDGRWLPVGSIQDLDLTTSLTAKHRSFLKPLEYGGSRSSVDAPRPTALLTDMGNNAVPLYIRHHEVAADNRPPPEDAWQWPPNTRMPTLPRLV